VELGISRESTGNAKLLHFKITRGKVEVPVVSWRMVPGEPIAHVGISGFSEQADAQLRQAVKEARQKGAKGLLVDLRGNPGGAAKQAQAVTSEFLKEGTVYIQQDAKGNQVAKPVLPGGVATDLPLVLLIDKGTASSAEILAGAVQDYKRGKLVGTTTFGTGTVLQEFGLSDGSAILLATAEWLTPKGRVIWHKGISPDVEVNLPQKASVIYPDDDTKLTEEELKKTTDSQFKKGLEVLREEMKAVEAGAAK
jgi:carboxyl-terminal processing protease